MMKLNWKRPLFYLLLPIFFVMIFLGFPLPVAPPFATKAKQEQSVPEKKRKKRMRLWRRADTADSAGSEN